jgi:hypothetical protein
MRRDLVLISEMIDAAEQARKRSGFATASSTATGRST